MNYYQIGVTESRNQSFGLLTYSFEKELEIGQVVQVPYGRLQTNGVVFKKEGVKPEFATKPVSSEIGVVLPQDLLHSLQWLSEYYVTAISSVVSNALPKGLDKKRHQAKDTFESKELIDMSELPNLTTGQESALKIIEENPKEPIIVHGITGSGKTRVYLERVKNTISRGKSAIVLTPEIGLTTQLVDEFENYFDNVVIVHSKLTESQRHKTWLTISKSAEPTVIIGARSALFSPVKDLGLIVIDEFHDQAYKQSQKPKYDAINLSVVRAKSVGAQVILGSATPDVERYYRSSSLKRPIVKMPTIANSHIKPPETKIIDMTDPANRSPKSWLSVSLHNEISQSLKAKEQVLIYHNRRGTASLMLCQSCGWSAECTRCSVPLTLHADKHILSCHICDQRQQVPKNCPDCNNVEIITKGVGTKQIVEDLSKLFPAARIERFDTDNNKEESLENNYPEV